MTCFKRCLKLGKSVGLGFVVGQRPKGRRLAQLCEHDDDGAGQDAVLKQLESSGCQDPGRLSNLHRAFSIRLVTNTIYGC